MLIMLEGPDGSGKSTLYDKLRKEFKHNFIRSLPRDDIGQYIWWKKRIESPCIYFVDRGFISEWVYRPIKQDEENANISLEEMANLCSNNLFVIYCKNKNSYDNMKQRGDNYITNEVEHEEISQRYQNVMQTINWFTNAWSYQYDYEQDAISYLIDYIKRFIERRQKEWKGKDGPQMML